MYNNFFFIQPSYPPSRAPPSSFARWRAACLVEWLSPSHYLTCCGIFHQTACKMTSCWCVFFWLVSVKKTIVFYSGLTALMFEGVNSTGVKRKCNSQAELFTQAWSFLRDKWNRESNFCDVISEMAILREGLPWPRPPMRTERVTLMKNFSNINIKE